MILRSIPVGITMTNCYLVGCEETHQGVVVDPGGHAERILQAIDESGLTVRYVLNTHCHFDHMAANADVLRATGALLALHPAEIPLLKARGGADLFGVSVTASPMPDLELTPGQVLEVGTLRFEVLHTPGHSPGGVTFYVPSEGAAFDGDVLFAQGVGRTDLPGGDWSTLIRSIREVLFALPDETTLYPGHGPPTTVGREKRSNPWVR
jgi:glyoxylase-like metal-dependent hydrolase (beta-lactamase superfamily II)